MADGLSLAASVVAVVQITGTIVSMTYNYGKDCWDAKDDSKRLLIEAKALHNVMEAAAALVKDDSAAKRFPNLGMLLTEDPEGLLEVCQEEVASVDKALRKAWNAWCDNHHTVRGLSELAKWPLKKKRLEHALEGIRSLHDAVNQALSLDTGRDVANIHAAIGRLEDNMTNLTAIVEDIKRMAAAAGDTTAAVLDSTTRIESLTIDLRLEQAEEAARAEEERERMRAAEARQRAQALHNEILRRLEPKDQARASLYAKHSELYNGRDDATSRWLLDGMPLSTVLEPGTSPRTLWIKGRAGCGKSMLASAIIEHVKKRDAVLAFFYFDFNNGAASKSETMLRSLVAQLVSACDTLPAVVTQFAEKHLDADGKVPPINETVQLLHDLVEHFSADENARAVVLVLDALDECVDRAALLRNLDDIRRWSLPLGIILTSHDLPDIAERLGADSDEADASATTIVIAADSEETSGDIDIFVRNQLETDDDFTKWSPTAKTKIAAALVSGAGGMFRWVACQLEMLRDCVTEGDLDRALASLPRSLSATYTAALQRVKTSRPRVLRLLFWLVVAQKTPSLEEASDFLAVDLTDPAAGPDGSCYFKEAERTARLHDIALFCPTLIRPMNINNMWRNTTGLRLAHSTVKDYLQHSNDLLAAFGPDITAAFSTALGTPPPLHPANLIGAAHNHVCKTYLGYVGSIREQPVTNLDKFDAKWPMIFDFASKWPFHFHSSCAAKADDAELHDMVFSLFRVPSGNSMNVFANYLIATNIFRSHRTYERSGTLRIARMIQASRDSLETVIRRLLDESAKNDTAGRDRAYFGNYVVEAVRYNHVGVLFLFLHSIRNLAVLGPAGHLLQRAARAAQHPDAFRELLNYLLKSGRVSNRDLDESLRFDPIRNFRDAFTLLVEAGARPGRAVLHQVIEEGEHALLELVLPRTEDKELQRATVLFSGRSFDIRTYRTDEDDARVLQLVATRLPGRVFSWAAGSEFCRKLVGPSLCPLENAFAAACMHGRVDVARRMIETGAVDVHAPLWTVAGWGAYPLFVAVFARQLEIAAACLAQGAEVDERGSMTSLYRPLSLAVFSNDLALVQLLEQHGAALDTVCSEYGTPLQTAVSMGHEETTEYLLTRPGVSVGQAAAPKSPPWAIAHEYAYWTPLRIAVAEGHMRIAALLLRHDPDAAFAECPADIYSGADEVLASSWEVPRPLLVVGSATNDTALVQLLLDAQGRDLHGKLRIDDERAEVRDQRRAVLAECLNKAVEYGCAQAVQQLLEAGVDANVRYESKTPLSRACFKLTQTSFTESHLETIRALVKHSANPDVDDATCEAFSNELWLDLSSADACRVVQASLALLGWEGKIDLRDTATVVSCLVASRARSRLVALLLVRFGEIADDTRFYGFDPALVDFPLDQEALATAVGVLCNRQHSEVLPFFRFLADDMYLLTGFEDGVPMFYGPSGDGDDGDYASF